MVCLGKKLKSWKCLSLGAAVDASHVVIECMWSLNYSEYKETWVFLGIIMLNWFEIQLK